jgi:hypothetical protein
MGISDMDDGDCLETIRLWEPEPTATLTSFSFRKRSSSEPNNELRRPVGAVDRLEVGVLTMATDMSLGEDREMAEDICVIKEVARCSDKFTVGLMADVALTFATSVAAGTAKGEKRLTI